VESSNPGLFPLEGSLEQQLKLIKSQRLNFRTFELVLHSSHSMWKRPIWVCFQWKCCQRATAFELIHSHTLGHLNFRTLNRSNIKVAQWKPLECCRQVCQWLNLIKSPAEHLNFRTIEPVLHHSCSVEEENSGHRHGNNSHCHHFESVNECGTASSSERGCLRMCVTCCNQISFAPSFEFLEVCACVTLQSISQWQQLPSCRKILMMPTTSSTPLRSCWT